MRTPSSQSGFFSWSPLLLVFRWHPEPGTARLCPIRLRAGSAKPFLPAISGTVSLFCHTRGSLPHPRHEGCIFHVSVQQSFGGPCVAAHDVAADRGRAEQAPCLTVAECGRDTLISVRGRARHPVHRIVRDGVPLAEPGEQRGECDELAPDGGGGPPLLEGLWERPIKKSGGEKADALFMPDYDLIYCIRCIILIKKTDNFLHGHQGPASRLRLLRFPATARTGIPGLSFPVAANS